MQIAIVQQPAAYSPPLSASYPRVHRQSSPSRQGRDIALRQSQSQQSVGAHRKVAADAIGISADAAGYRQRCDIADIAGQYKDRCIRRRRRQGRRDNDGQRVIRRHPPASPPRRRLLLGRPSALSPRFGKLASSTARQLLRQSPPRPLSAYSDSRRLRRAPIPKRQRPYSGLIPSPKPV